MRAGLPGPLVEALHLGLLGRLLLAAVLGGLIGFEREVSGKPAGLRTNLLICVGATLLMELSIGVAELSGPVVGPGGAVFRSDPARIAAQIVSGIGFIGAGTILHARGGVTGLTTAATIWVVAAIGMAVGAGAYVQAVGTTVLVFASLGILGRLEDVVKVRRSTRRYSFLVEPDPAALERVEEALRAAGLRVRVDSLAKGELHYQAVLGLSGPAALHDRTVNHVLSLPGVRRIRRVS